MIRGRLAFLCCLLAFTACKQDNVDDKKTNLLTSRPWKVTYKDDDSTSTPANSIFRIIQNCEIDDTYTFETSGQLVKNDGNIQCGDNATLKATQAYSIDVNNKKITIDGINYNLLELSENRLKYSGVLSDGNGFVNVVYIYSH